MAGESELDVTAHDKNTIELGEVLVTRDLPEKSIQELLKKHTRLFNVCFRQALEKQPDLKGKIVFKNENLYESSDSCKIKVTFQKQQKA